MGHGLSSSVIQGGDRTLRVRPSNSAANDGIPISRPSRGVPVALAPRSSKYCSEKIRRAVLANSRIVAVSVTRIPFRPILARREAESGTMALDWRCHTRYRVHLCDDERTKAGSLGESSVPISQIWSISRTDIPRGRIQLCAYCVSLASPFCDR